eukprot:UN25097
MRAVFVWRLDFYLDLELVSRASYYLVLNLYFASLSRVKLEKRLWYVGFFVSLDITGGAGFSSAIFTTWESELSGLSSLMLFCYGQLTHLLLCVLFVQR